MAKDTTTPPVPDIKALQEENSALKAENEALKKAAEEQAAEIQQLKERPSASKLPVKTFKVNRKEYGFTAASFYLGGKKITTDDVLADKALQAKLVEMKSGVIKKL